LIAAATTAAHREDWCIISPMPDANTPHQFTDQYTFAADFRGEEMTYTEAGRTTSMQWFWSNGYSIVASSITTWTNADGSTAPVSESERTEIIARAVKYAQDVQHVKMKVDP
jgi:hypothetical protein